MALYPLTPMTFESFCDVVGVSECAEWLVAEIEGQEEGGWQGALARYRWLGYGLDLTLECRRRQGAALRSASDAAAWAVAVEHVREWSGSNLPFSVEDLVGLRSSCEILRHEPGDRFSELLLRRPATASKVYAGAWPGEWAVYDSRLGLRLTELVSRWWDEKREELASQVLRFPVPPSRGDQSLPPEFVTLGAQSERQARLGFVYVSWLCRLAARRLGELDISLPGISCGPALDGWTVQLVEMALFATQPKPASRVGSAISRTC